MDMAPSARIQPGLERKLELLGQAAQFDLSCACGQNPPRVASPEGRWIYPAVLPTGRTIPLLKVLQQSGCERNCLYCVQRCGGAGAGAERPGAGPGNASFSPDELARLFVDLRARRSVQGLFLSSVIRGGAVATMDRMLATVELLRRCHAFRGYIHLKIVPGCAPDQVDRAMELATRVSVNMEAPGARYLNRIAPAKDLERQILAPMRQVARAQAQGRFARAGQTTQFVVGAGEETDRELAATAAMLYRTVRLARVYYSAFQPLPGTPLEGRAPAPLMREHRLYQVDFLLRKYGFTCEELPFDRKGQLSLETDPKTLWARAHPERFPVEVNTAPPEELMRVPGIGPVSAKRLAEVRGRERIRSLAALRAAGAVVAAAAPYVLLDGRRAPGERQLVLFA